MTERSNTRGQRSGWRAVLLAGVALMASGQAAHAQDASNEAAEEESTSPPTIVVTAERRAMDLQDTPLSILAVTSEVVEAKGIEDLEDLAAFSPNLAIMPTRGGGNNTANFVIRGIGGGGGATGERGVGLYIDGIYMPRTSGAVLSVLDIDRIEVLRGPQGTLFGRNSTGGAIRIFSQQPSDRLEGYVRGTVGNQGRLDIAGTINLPLSEGLAVRAQVARLEKGGFVTRGTEKLGAEKEFVTRFQAKWEPGDRFEATLGVLFTKSRSNGTPYVMTEFDMKTGIEGVIQGNYADWINDAFKAAGGAPLAAFNDPRIVSGKPYVNNSLCFMDDFNPDYDPACNQLIKDRYLQGDLKLVFNVSDAVSVTSITGLADLRHRGNTDFQVLGTENRTENVDSEVVYQELQLNASALDENIDLVAGGNYFREESAAPNFNLTRRGTSVFPSAAQQAAIALGTLSINSNTLANGNADAGLFRTADAVISQLSESFGLFANVTWHVTDRLDITGGLRQAWDKKNYSQTRFPGGNPGIPDFTPATGTTSTTVNAGDTFKALDWRGTINFDVTDDIMAYATVSKAYKAGSYSYTVASNSTGEAQSREIKPIPNEKVINYEAGLRMTLFDRLRINPTVFIMDYTNRQAAVQVVCGSAALPNIPPNSPQCPVGFLIQVQNQGDVKLKGFELDGQLVITPDLSIDGAFAMTDPTLKNPPVGTVNLFPDIPSPTWNIGATFSPDTALGRLTLNASYARVGPQETHPSRGTDSSYTLPAYGVMNARARLQLDDFPASISVYANNLLDNVYATYAQRFGGGFWDAGNGAGLASPLRSALSEIRGRPREVGVTLQVDF